MSDPTITVMAPQPGEGVPAEPVVPPRRAPLGRRLLRGDGSEPGWARPTLVAILGVTAVLYLWGLGSNGWSNGYYSAAVQAGTQSWKAFFFGSFDAAGFITVDKTPASLWLMELSGRIFGFGTWSMLVPQALCGVLSVALLYATVRRWFPVTSALLAAAVLAVTPAATLMFRYNNPDALLVLLMVVAAYATVRAVERAGAGWLAVAGVAVGFGYLTKMLQVFLVLPALALTYLVAAPTSVGRRLLHLLGAGGAVLLSAGWWVAAVELIPAGSRPYVGGSTTNSILELTFGYNGLARLTGGDRPANPTGGGGLTGGGLTGGGLTGGGGPGGGGGIGGQAGLGRLFNASFGGQASWLIPAALIALVALLWLTWRTPRVDRTRAAAILWGGWLLVTGLVLSLMSGTVHEYYTVALAPGIAALIGIAVPVLWQDRHRLSHRLLLAAIVLVTAGWGYVLLNRTPDFQPWLRYLVAVAGLLAAAAAILLPAWRPEVVGRRAATVGALAAALAVFGGPLAYSVQTAAAAGRSGGIVTAGPSVPGAGGFRGGGFRDRAFPGAVPGGAVPGGAAPGGAAPAGAASGGGRFGGGGAEAADPALTALLKSSSSAFTWPAAAISANSSAAVQLASGRPVMAIGGFTGSDPAPTLDEFKALVAAGKVHYFIGGNRGGAAQPGSAQPGSAQPGGGFGRGGTGNEITQWVTSTFTPTTIGNTTVYDLSTPTPTP